MGHQGHDAADGFRAIVVSDDDVVRVQLVGAGVEREDFLAFPGAAHDQRALNLIGIEDVHRPALVEGHVVGDVNQRRDRPQADRQQPLLHPFRARTVLHAAHEAIGEAGAEMVFELKPRGVDKGGALREFMRGTVLADRIPVMAGDDLTDESAFAAAQEAGGFGIKVGTGDSIAPWRLSGPADLARWLGARSEFLKA